ncbi:excinuclease ABC subunit UvrA [bacterium]|nr:excinuclease ABC subunit UvrA [bacterium]
MRPPAPGSSVEGSPGETLKPPIRIEGARTHNLREISCEVPQRALTVVTGVSGSGKSSLVFDTLYAEGQRRFVQSLSTYTRLFLERMERPDVDFINHVPPAIALAQKNAIRNARSTVGTITEVNDHLRLLWTHVGETSCVACGGRMLRDDPESGLGEVAALPAGSTILVTAAIDPHGLPWPEVVAALVGQGHRRALGPAGIVRIDEADPVDVESLAEGGRLRLVLDRLIAGRTARARSREALDAAFGMGEGRVRLVVEPPVGEAASGTTSASATGIAAARAIDLDRRFTCRDCGREQPEPAPNLFSFNSPLGACPGCEGFGRVTGVDLDKVIPDPRKTLEGGAIAPWQTPSNLEMQEWMLRVAKRHGVRTDVPWSKLDAASRRFALDGEPKDGEKRRRGEHRFPGVHGFFRWLEGKRYKTHVRILLARYRGYTPCDACGGHRLRPEALATRVGGLHLGELLALPISEVARWAESLPLDPHRQARAARLLSEVRSRLSYLVAVGLDYLTLARQARTLSGGEAQRIHLASALGGALTDTLYCLDEPTVGLHARDSRRLLDVLHRLTEVGNTVVVVEHDPVVIEGADHVIDLGPGGGARGGRVIHQGPPDAMPADLSETARLLRERSVARAAGGASIAAERPVRVERGAGRGAMRGRAAAAKGPGAVRIVGARENNLKDVTVEIPHGRLTCVTGVSGSGKSTLVEQVLWMNHLRAQGQGVEAGACDSVSGLEAFDEVVLMTQAPVGRSARSNAVTYLKAYDEIRRLLASTNSAKADGIAPGAFSFNSDGGRCETCSGMGTVTIEMHFMADLTVTCDACGGARFKPHVLEIRYRGRNVNEILALTIDEAFEFFADVPRIRSRLVALRSVGLGYLTLGQPTSTLSGGEAQRLKLASFVDEDEGGDEETGPGKRRFLLFDEPTTGLHLSDVARLIDVLHGLVERGHTVLVVEHHLDFIAAADHVIDLGPEGGDRGGEVVATGTPRELAERGGTPTSDALRELLLGIAPAASASPARRSDTPAPGVAETRKPSLAARGKAKAVKAAESDREDTSTGAPRTGRAAARTRTARGRRGT